LHPDIRRSLDLWIAVVRNIAFLCWNLSFLISLYNSSIKTLLTTYVNQVGGVHSHLISRVQRDKNRVGCFLSHNEIMMAVFPMFQQHIEPHLVHAHVSILALTSLK